jgi:hypothetical protein
MKPNDSPANAEKNFRIRATDGHDQKALPAQFSPISGGRRFSLSRVHFAL